MGPKMVHSAHENPLMVTVRPFSNSPDPFVPTQVQVESSLKTPLKLTVGQNETNITDPMRSRLRRAGEHGEVVQYYLEGIGDRADSLVGRMLPGSIAPDEAKTTVVKARGVASGYIKLEIAPESNNRKQVVLTVGGTEGVGGTTKFYYYLENAAEKCGQYLLKAQSDPIALNRFPRMRQFITELGNIVKAYGNVEFFPSDAPGTGDGFAGLHQNVKELHNLTTEVRNNAILSRSMIGELRAQMPSFLEADMGFIQSIP
jgi:hypothetical protein